VQQEINAEDKQIIQKTKEKFGARLECLAPEVVLRFVRGYAHEEQRFEATCERLEFFLKKKDDYQFDTILDEAFPAEDECVKAWPIYIYGEDKQGHLVLYDEIASCKPEEINKAFKGKPQKLKKFRYRFWKRVNMAKRAQWNKYDGQLIYKHVMVFDMSGFTRHHFAAEYRTLVKEIIGEEQHLFPETLYKTFIINAPLAFRMIWGIVSNFVDPITYKKISVLGGNYLGEIEKEISRDQFPQKYGGTGKWPIRMGNVPDYGEKEQEQEKEKEK